MRKILLLNSFLAALAFGQTVSGPVTINGSITINAAPIVLVNHTSGCSATSFTTSAIDNTNANSLYCLVTSSNASPTVSDSSSNTWVTTLTSATNATSGVTTKLFYVTNATVSASQTFTVTAAGAKPSMECLAFRGTAPASSFDQQNQTNNGSGMQISTGPITPGTNGQVLITGVGFDANSGSLNVGNPPNFDFILIEQQAFGSCYGSGMAYFVQPTAAATNAQWTLGGTASNNQAKIASFK